MRKVLDFNTDQPVLEVRMPDEARTIFEVTLPTEALINELQNMGPKLQTLQAADKTGATAAWELAAKLISCNTDLCEVTADELQSKYGMKLGNAIQFFRVYKLFVENIIDEKN